MIFVGVDWAEAHHDVHVADVEGKRLAKARLPEGVEGIARFHELVNTHGPGSQPSSSSPSSGSPASSSEVPTPARPRHQVGSSQGLKHITVSLLVPYRDHR
jgi:hypothetical protein